MNPIQDDSQMYWGRLKNESPGQRCWARLRESDSLGYTRAGRDLVTRWDAQWLGYVLLARNHGGTAPD